MSEQNPSLSEQPADGLSIIQARERATTALLALGGALTSENQAELASALAASSPVDAVCKAFRTLSQIEGLSGALLARSIEIAELIAEHSWHGLAAEAAAYAADARSRLPQPG